MDFLLLFAIPHPQKGPEEVLVQHFTNDPLIMLAAAQRSIAMDAVLDLVARYPLGCSVGIKSNLHWSDDQSGSLIEPTERLWRCNIVITGFNSVLRCSEKKIENKL